MADLTRKEFAAMCRTTVSIVNTNVHRDKVVINDETKKIDTEDPLNKAFLNKYFKAAEQRDRKQRISNDTDELYDEVVEKVSRKIQTDAAETSKAKSRKKSTETISWDTRKKKADALLQERKAERELLNLEKLAGKLIPLDLVFNIIRIHNQDIFATFQNDLENQASIFCDILAGGDRKKLASITTKLGEALSKTIERAKDVAMSSIEQAVEDYSETRNRGEKK